MPITDADRELLRIAATPYRYAGLKESAMVGACGLTPIQAWQRLNALLDTEAALAAEPVAVNMLRRRRDRLQLSRSERRTA